VWRPAAKTPSHADVGSLCAQASVLPFQRTGPRTAIPKQASICSCLQALPAGHACCAWSRRHAGVASPPAEEAARQDACTLPDNLAPAPQQAETSATFPWKGRKSCEPGQSIMKRESVMHMRQNVTHARAGSSKRARQALTPLPLHPRPANQNCDPLPLHPRQANQNCDPPLVHPRQASPRMPTQHAQPASCTEQAGRRHPSHQATPHASRRVSLSQIKDGGGGEVPSALGHGGMWRTSLSTSRQLMVLHGNQTSTCGGIKQARVEVLEPALSSTCTVPIDASKMAAGNSCCSSTRLYTEPYSMTQHPGCVQ
jgi:hypothetical protein